MTGRIVTAREQAEMQTPWYRPGFRFISYHRENAGVVARNGNDEPVGYLTWWDPSHITAGIDMEPRPAPYELARIEVRPDYQRCGIASHLFNRAREWEPRLHHSPHMTVAGARWAASMGYIPEESVAVADMAGQGIWNR